MVERYVLGVLPANSKRLVEEAFDSNPCIQEWFLELDELPDHVQDEGDVASQSLSYGNAFRYESKNPHDRRLQELTDFMHECGVFEDDADGDQDASQSELLNLVDDATIPMADEGAQVSNARPAWPGASMNCSFKFAQSLAPSKERTYPLAATKPASSDPPNEEDRFGQEENCVFIRCDASDIPSGLCRLEVRETDGTVTWYYPRFRRIADRWIFHESIENILGRRPTSRDVEVAVITATAETRDQFCNNEKVREAVVSWPSESKQRELAEEFLKGSHE
jgi:hypothetical protein